MTRGGLLHLRGRLREEVLVPEVEVTARAPGQLFRALMEYESVVAVFLESDPDTCIGWADVELLGYYSVRHWLAAERDEGDDS